MRMDAMQGAEPEKNKSRTNKPWMSEENGKMKTERFDGWDGVTQQRHSGEGESILKFRF